MERRTAAAFTVAMVAAVAALFVGILAPGGSPPSPEARLERSSEAMADESFRVTAPCEHCDEPTVLEYAPPDRIRVASGSPRGDNWPFYLYSDGTAYFSQSGERWRTDAQHGNDWLAFYQRMLDPRVLLKTVTDPKDDGFEDVGGRSTLKVSCGLNVDAMLAYLPPEERDIGRGELRQLLESAEVTFWIDAGDDRVRRMRFFSAGEDGGEAVFEIDFAAPVEIPDSVRSMDAEEADRLGRDSEDCYRELLDAMRLYHTANGQYPRELTPQTLAKVLPPGSWPTNPFTGEPVRYDPGTPGNFDYRLTANGEHIIFQIDGWDGSQAYYDSERFGPIPARTR